MSGEGEKKRRRPPRITRTISGRISPRMYEAVMGVVESSLYVDVTDYLRDLIRRDLDSRGINIEEEEKVEDPHG